MHLLSSISNLAGARTSHCRFDTLFRTTPVPFCLGKRVGDEDKSSPNSVMPNPLMQEMTNPDMLKRDDSMF